MVDASDNVDGFEDKASTPSRVRLVSLEGAGIQQ
jgi:hypothetical protein